MLFYKKQKHKHFSKLKNTPHKHNKTNNKQKKLVFNINLNEEFLKELKTPF